MSHQLPSLPTPIQISAPEPLIKRSNLCQSALVQHAYTGCRVLRTSICETVFIPHPTSRLYVVSLSYNNLSPWIQNQRIEYLVKWEEFSDSENSWEGKFIMVD